RSLDEAGDVGEDEAAAVAEADHAEVRRERRERVVGNFRAGPRGRGQERGLPRVGEADDARVGQELQLEAHGALLARRARLGGARRGVPRRFEMDVAAPAVAAARDDRARPRLVEVVEHLARVGVHHDRPERHLDDEVLAGLAVLVAVAARLAALGAVVLLVLEIEERGQLLVGDEHHAAAVAAVAARRAAAGNVRLAPEGRDAVAAVAGLDVDLGFVDEDHAAGAAGTTETRRLVLVCRSYFTMPSTRANSVKSRPMPTFWPGWMTVPSCRTRMLPARTSSPP